MIYLRRLVAASVLLILVGLLLLLPSSSFVSLLTTGSAAATTGASFTARGAAGSTASTGDMTAIESVAGFGLIGEGLVLEVLSLFADVGGTAAVTNAATPGEEAKRK